MSANEALIHERDEALSNCARLERSLEQLKREMSKLHERAVNAELAYLELAMKRPYDCYWSRRALAAEKKCQ